MTYDNHKTNKVFGFLKYYSTLGVTLFIKMINIREFYRNSKKLHKTYFSCRNYFKIVSFGYNKGGFFTFKK